jgi:hypothetical protein
MTWLGYHVQLNALSISQQDSPLYIASLSPLVYDVYCFLSFKYRLPTARAVPCLQRLSALENGPQCGNLTSNPELYVTWNILVNFGLFGFSLKLCLLI